jgi:expansin (peptidoglycan-binding protein)
MNKKKITLTYLTILLIGTPLFSQEQDNTLNPEEFAAGWELLFDGETLDGWKAYNGDEPETWMVKDNAIYCNGTKGGDDLMTVGSFADFDLKFEWKIVKNGNSGVIYRTREGRQWSKPHLTGPEYQVHDEAGKFDKLSTGSLYDVYATSGDKEVNPAMEWNTGRIRISNNLVTHWVNGKIVMQCQMHSDDWNAKVADSKWKDNPYFAKSPFGHIDFQNHGSEVWYRNVKILRL